MRQAFHTLAARPNVPRWGGPPPPPPKAPEEGGGGGGGDRPLLIGRWSTATLDTHPLKDSLDELRRRGAPESFFRDMLGVWVFLLLPESVEMPEGAGRVVAMPTRGQLPTGERFGLLLPFAGPKEDWRPGGKARELWDRLLLESGWSLIEAGR